MKLIQVNTEQGHLLAPLLNFISEQQPDIICAQEVLNSQEKIRLSANYQTLEHIKKAGDFSHHFFSPTWSFEAFGTDVQIGNAIFSKFPISNQQTVFIRGQYEQKITFQNADINIRNLQICSLEISGRRLNIANHQAYLAGPNPLGDEQSIIFAEKVARHLQPYLNCLIFCGDLNFIPSSPALEPLTKLGLRNLTVEFNVKTTLSSIHRAPQEDKDRVACDYVFYSDNIKINRFSVSDKIVSDHKALILEFDI